MSRARLTATLTLIACLFAAGYARQPPSPEAVINGLTFRNIGPFRTAAWVTEVAVPESPLHDHLYTMYAATRSGGLWKTTNAGTTWSPISDSVGVAAVGAVAIAPSNPAVVWMGTGDQANARSSYSGKGVFKSVDAGATWQPWVSPTRTTSRASSSTRRILTWSTSRRWAISSPGTKSAACSGRRTAERRGRRSST